MSFAAVSRSMALMAVASFVFGSAHAQAQSADRLSAADLEELLAPIALYPDTLLANMLAAAVYSDDLRAAAAYVAGGGTVAEELDVEWDPSVKAVAMIPEALKKLGDYPDWTDALGQAYLAQPEEVLSAVQTLRAKAYANESLRSTPEQNIVVEGDTIIVEPADPQVIYVPRYDPAIVYAENHPSVTDVVVGFGVGIAVAAIHHALVCDWRRNSLIWSPRPVPWGPGYRPYYRPGLHGTAWRPFPGRPRPIRPGWASGWGGISSRPNFSGLPGRPIGSRPHFSNWRPPRPRPRPPALARPQPPRPRPPQFGGGQPTPLPSLRPPGQVNRPDRPGLGRPGLGSNRPGPGQINPGNRPPLPSRPDRPSIGNRPRPGADRLAPRRDSGFRPPSGDSRRAISRPSGGSRPSMSFPKRPAARPSGGRGGRR
ncbi:MAG: DUF3300 domain-containing protein [Phycisphaerae bacterium]|nr:DUF3300 domain-containing protein [Phycisphaerae bacterium]